VRVRVRSRRSRPLASLTSRPGKDAELLRSGWARVESGRFLFHSVREVGMASPGHDRWPWIATALAAGHLLYAGLALGLRTEHVVADVLFGLAAWCGPFGRRFTRLVLPLWIVGLLYDSLRLMNGLKGPIRVGELYELELRWFGVRVDGVRRVLPDVFLKWTHPVLDLVCGFAYIAYLLQPILFFVYFVVRDGHRARRLAWGFLALNVLGIATYLAYPAAPPWYVQEYGPGPARLDAPPSAAGAARFDELTGIPLFSSFYSRSPNVFGAMPSLHAAYPILVLGTVLGMGALWVAGCSVFAALVAFAAVYLRHHYVWDILVGWLYAVLAVALLASRVARSRE
jgi:hypothetical protein